MGTYSIHRRTIRDHSDDSSRPMTQDSLTCSDEYNLMDIVHNFAKQAALIQILKLPYLLGFDIPLEKVLFLG